MRYRNFVKKWYNEGMLVSRYNRLSKRWELQLRGVPVEARITPAEWRVESTRDWQLWVAQAPGLPATLEKSPMRLSIESRLRAWLLRRYRCRLWASRFATLYRIAEREAAMSDVGR